MVAGYSGTPLPKKLGIREGSRVGYRGAPKGFAATLGPLPLGAKLAPSRPGRGDNILLLFAPDQRSLDEALPDMLSRMGPETALWICWPKKTSPLASDITGDTVRRTGLAAGVVDIKVCAIDEDWSGIKFVVRVENRPTGRKK
ncbi:MAG: DUF3052 family protein [Acidobacteria bacterium]|nr:MAG: DUF3052 family protein [Acidobacteriota bacterium]